MAGCLRLLKPKTTLFLLCDVQEKFRPVMPLFDNLIKNCCKLTCCGKALDVPLLVTEHYSEKLGKTVPAINICHAKAVVQKTRFSMMVPEVEKNIKSIFNGKTPSDVVLFGLETHVCIEQTTIELMERNINVFLVADCVCSRLNQDRDLALARLRAGGAIVTTSETVIFSLLREKENPKFKEVHKHVKEASADMKIAIHSKSKKC